MFELCGGVCVCASNSIRLRSENELRHSFPSNYPFLLVANISVALRLISCLRIDELVCLLMNAFSTFDSLNETKFISSHPLLQHLRFDHVSLQNCTLNATEQQTNFVGFSSWSRFSLNSSPFFKHTVHCTVCKNFLHVDIHSVTKKMWQFFYIKT